MNLSFRVGDAEEDVRRNRELFFAALGLDLHRAAIPGQVHGSAILHVREPGGYPETDGLITTERNLPLCVSVADCVPVLLCDPAVPAVAAIHAGWRGSADRIAAKGVKMLMAECGAVPERIEAFIGPSASVCCYRVGEDVASRFPPSCIRRDGDGVLVDLKRANLEQLLESGLRRELIEVSPLCTISEEALLHSYRRDGEQSGRMMAIIGILQSPATPRDR
jgi:hypothetical protein